VVVNGIVDIRVFPSTASVKFVGAVWLALVKLCAPIIAFTAVPVVVATIFSGVLGTREEANR